MDNLIRAAMVAILIMMGIRGYSQSFLTNGLVAYYPFNGNANDASGNSNDGTAIGAVLSTDRFGRLNSAYQFNGVDEYISFNSVPTMQADNMTLSAWVNPASINQYAMAVCLGYDDGSSGNGFSFGLASSNIGANAGNHVAGILGGVSGLDSGQVYQATNVWYHVVLLRRGGVIYFYLNGLQGPTTNTSVPLTPTSFTIGSETGIRFFNGQIDDVRIYNRALSATEVMQLYQYEAPPSMVSLIEAVKPSFNQLTVGANYQLQVSTDLVNWINQGASFAASNSTMVSTQYFDTPNWNQLFFRLQQQ